MSNKRIIKLSLLFIIVTIYTLLFIYNIFLLNTIRFNWSIVDDNKYNSIMDTREEYQEDMINHIRFNDVELFDVFDKNEFFYSMLEKDKYRYNPFIKYESDLSNTRIVILNNRITDDLIANNEHIKLLIYNADYYKEYEVVVTTLPIMNISFEDNEENNGKLVQTTYELHSDGVDSDIYGNLFLFDNTNNIKNESALKFHVRGGTSTWYIKKGFKLSLKDEVGNSNNLNLLDMRKDDDWILYAGYDDQERIRNVFSARLWYDCCSANNDFGIKAGMYYKYIELFMNGKYSGLYALGFPIDEKQLSIQDGEVLFKKEYWTYDFNGRIDGYELKSKGDPLYSSNVLIDYYKKLQSSDSVDDIGGMIDINNQIDFYLFNILVQNVDGVSDKSSKNLFISFKNDDENRMKSLYVPWDLNFTFGNLWSQTMNNQIDIYGISSKNNDSQYNSLGIGRIRELNGDLAINMIKKRWNDLRTTYFSNKYINSIIDGYQFDIFYSGAMNRDMLQWPDSTFNDSKDLKHFKNYVEERLEYMDYYIYSL